jgi:predicted RNA-binding protein with TRAM domain/ubiquinone biosynthesis protein UbiJ
VVPVAADEASSIAEGPHPDHRTGQRADYLLRGIADEILSSEPIQEVQARVQALSDRVARLERLERRVGELEARLWTVEDLRQGLHHTVENIRDLEVLTEAIDERQRQQAERIAALEDELAAEKKRTERLEARLEAIETVFSDRPLDKERAHVEAQRCDPSEVVTLGETYEVVVKEVEDGYAPSAMGRIDGLVVWFDIDNSETVSEGNVAEVRIDDLRENIAEATLLEVLDNE